MNKLIKGGFFLICFLVFILTIEGFLYWKFNKEFKETTISKTDIIKESQKAEILSKQTLKSAKIPKTSVKKEIKGELVSFKKEEGKKVVYIEGEIVEGGETRREIIRIEPLTIAWQSKDVGTKKLSFKDLIGRKNLEFILTLSDTLIIYY